MMLQPEDKISSQWRWFPPTKGVMHKRSDSMPTCLIRHAIGLMLAAAATAAAAQDVGTLEPKALPALEHPDAPATPAKQLFGRITGPTQGSAHVEGFYSNGCLAGAVALPVSGPEWQVMRLSRNRNWGHPTLIRFLENLATKVHKAGDWNGLLVSDMSQPRGGPMMTGHASHQVGLDADIWLTPMPDRELTGQEREEMSAVMMVAEDRKDVDPKLWTPGHVAVIKAAAHDANVERIFVNAAIKKALCRDTDPDRVWLNKVRPYWGHDYHFHVRLHCPPGSPDCRPQPPPPPGDGCGKELDWWFTDAVLHPKPPHFPIRPKPPLTMANLPAACRVVLAAPDIR
jgi:penicillin-insensitive murein endopeptidase